MFAKIEANFWHYINKSQVKRLLIVENSLSEESGKALEEIMLCTTSIFIVLGKNLDAIEMINRSKSFCKEFRLKKVQNMLKLIEAALRSSIGEYTFALELIDSVKSFFVKTQDSEGQAECHLLKGLIKEALDSKNELILSKSQSVPTDAEGQFDLAENLFRKAEQSLGCARAKLALAQYKLKSSSNETQIFDSLVSAIEVFKNLDFVF